MQSTVAAQERARARAQYIYILRVTCLFCRRDLNRREVLRSAEIECVGGATVYAVSAWPPGTIPVPERVRAGSPRCRSGAIFPGQALPRRDRAVELVTRRAAHREAPQAMMVLRAFRAKPHPRDRTPETNKALSRGRSERIDQVSLELEQGKVWVPPSGGSPSSVVSIELPPSYAR